MPLPTPNKDETKEEFMSRCIETLLKQGGEFDSKEQCYVVCYSKWEDNEPEEDEDD